MGISLNIFIYYVYVHNHAQSVKILERLTNGPLLLVLNLAQNTSMLLVDFWAKKGKLILRELLCLFCKKAKVDFTQSSMDWGSSLQNCTELKKRKSLSCQKW